MIKPPFKLIENSLHALVRDPAGLLHVPNSRRSRFECLLSHLLGKVREI
jgi:hypothetical protein